MMAIMGIPTAPTTKPAFLNASGIANMPVPMFPFSKCSIVSALLQF
jgi:hypothetical protein